MACETAIFESKSSPQFRGVTYKLKRRGCETCLCLHKYPTLVIYTVSTSTQPPMIDQANDRRVQSFMIFTCWPLFLPTPCKPQIQKLSGAIPQFPLVVFVSFCTPLPTLPTWEQACMETSRRVVSHSTREPEIYFTYGKTGRLKDRQCVQL